MTAYQNILFDLDDTLLDYGAAEEHALQQLFQDFNLMLTPAVKRTFQEYNVGMWQRYERGELSWDQLMDHLFADYFKVYHKLSVSGRQTIKTYLTYLSDNHQLIPGTRTVLNYLKQNNYRVYAVTNGQKIVQDKRLKESKLLQFFDGIFISQIIGFQKPDKKMFDYVLTKINGQRANTIMVGDSLSSDIQGGFNAHLDTIWFNPHSIHNSTRLKPTFEIHRLTELKSLL
ncbi:MAG: YjjG family noncanonical pyrimidine nucleotidase [Limosilactobacillus sp.]|uniref:YjjG family noncanonical pyrimidine nucleotidase n=1 Tax=Limosilactobacillus sp. TaxID=2773925 RepID=UPI0025BBBD8B|nr:YjjG family noncanonical pyrimidine nucleotidase [Limosilactobacillus sp.]MCI1975510.1 YjjG family noncanonical pyrimidine nucleotidase [Limosilactobacillus sp.]MCI2030747.1 YjjG family noncanonical pyrimidine nucleotidase [Limosilactobacillus sp.]